MSRKRPSAWFSLMALSFVATAGLADEIEFGSNDAYGGNVSSNSGQGFAYIASRKAFKSSGEGMTSVGFEVTVRWKYPKSQSEEKFDVICRSTPTNDPQVIPYEPPDDMPPIISINKSDMPERFSPITYYYDIWFSVCENDTNVF